MKYRLEFWIFYLLSSLIFIVNIEAADISYPEDNVGMLYGYTHGLFTSTDSPTDLAIDGNGFFMLRNSESEDVFYTKLVILILIAMITSFPRMDILCKGGSLMKKVKLLARLQIFKYLLPIDQTYQ